MVVALLVALNSSWVIDKLAQKYAPAYQIGYRHISGNLFNGVHIAGLTYQKQTVADEIVYRWNPLALLDKRISFQKIEVTALNVGLMQSLTEKMQAQPKPQEEESGAFDFEVFLRHFKLSLMPFEYEGVFFHHTTLSMNGLHFNQEGITLKSFMVDVESNVTHLSLTGKIQDHCLTLEKGDISEVKLKALLGLIPQKEQNQTAPQEKELPTSSKRPLIESLKIQSFHVALNPYEREKLKLEALEVDLSNSLILLQEGQMQRGDLLIALESNVANLHFKGEILSNHLLGKVALTPHKALFTLYHLPLREASIGRVNLDVNLSKEQLEVMLSAKAKRLLKAKEGGFNVDIDSLTSAIHYDMDAKKLLVETEATLTTPYAKGVEVRNDLRYLNENISYSGEVNHIVLEGLSDALKEPLKGLKVAYDGNLSALNVKLSAKLIQGSFISPDLKKGSLMLESREPLVLKQFVQMPEGLEEGVAHVKINAPIDFANPLPLDANVTIDSNLVRVKSQLHYNKALTYQTTLALSENSLLEGWQPKVVWSKLFPLSLHGRLGSKKATLIAKGRRLDVDVTYGLENQSLESKLSFADMHLKAKGLIQKRLSLSLRTPSIKKTLKGVGEYYPLGEVPPLDGSLLLDATVENMKQLKLNISSPSLRYQEKKKPAVMIDKVNVTMLLEQGRLRLEKYHLLYDKQEIFSTKPSLITLEGSEVKLSPLWLNDQLRLEGRYDLKKGSGTLKSDARALSIKHDYVQLKSALSLRGKREGEHTQLNGKVTLLGGKVTYDISKKRFESDSDIVIVQKMKKKEENRFMRYLSSNIQIETKRPLILRQGAISLRLKPSLTLNKAENSEMMVLGSIELMKGGYYRFEGKRFVLDKSFIYFTGNPNKPLLDIKVHYKALKHLITISVTGSPSRPNILFSSTPALSKEQILSVILFDSEVGGDAHSGDEMMRMMGGAMAKAALNDIGVKLDHLVLGEGNSIEVGKKLTNKITIIYINDIVSRVKLQYEHSPKTQSVFEMSQESQSYDIIFKDDF